MDIITGKLGPRELALAGAFGVLLGLLPKDNLLFISLAGLFFFSHANLVVGIVLTGLVSIVAPWIHEYWAHPLGTKVLTAPGGQNVIGALFKIPLAPWTMLDKTVVLGSFLTGMLLFVPLYLVIWTPLKLVWPRPRRTEEQTTPGKE